MNLLQPSPTWRALSQAVSGIYIPDPRPPLIPVPFPNRWIRRRAPVPYWVPWRVPWRATFPTVATTNVSSHGTNVTSHTVNLPASIASGDLLVIVFTMDDPNATSVTWPSGWTQISSTRSGGQVRMDVRYRIADGSEGSTITITSGASEQSAHQSYRITGWHGTTAPEGGTPATGTSANPNPPTLSPSWGAADTLWLVFCGADNGITVSAAPTNYTNLISTAGGEGGGGATTGSARRSLNATSDDPGTFTISESQEWVAQTIAIRPGGGAFEIDAAPGTYAISGAAAGLLAARLLDAAPGTYVITGQDAGLLAGRAINAEPGTYALTGANASLLATRLLDAAPGAYVITGAAAELLAGRILVADPGAYVLTGFAAELLFTPSGAFVLNAEPGTYALTGAVAGLLAARLLNAEPGVYVLTGQAATTVAGRVLDAGPGTYLLTGADAALQALRVLVAESGAYAIAGADAGTLAARVLSANPGTYVIVGVDATLSVVVATVVRRHFTVIVPRIVPVDVTQQH